MEVASPVCCELREVDTTGWRRQQEEDADPRPVLQWVDLQQRPPWEEVAVLSLATKGLWAKFEALRPWVWRLQGAWKEPATGEVRWQVVVLHSLCGEVLQAVHGAVGLGHFWVTKTLRHLRLLGAAQEGRRELLSPL